MLEYVLLGLLLDQSRNGYQIKQFMMISTSNFLKASYGSLYPALGRLEQKGLIMSKEEREKGTYTKIYSITETGKARFLSWLKVPADVTDATQNHLVKLFFYDYLDIETKRSLFKLYIHQADDAILKLQQTKPNAAKCSGSDRMSTLFYGIGYCEYIRGFYRQKLEELTDTES